MFESKFRVLAMGARMPHGGVVLDRSRLLLAGRRQAVGSGGAGGMDNTSRRHLASS